MTRRNPLLELHGFGVSVWYDNISRELLASGELARLIREDGVTGVTSNPTIFEKALAAGHHYDEALRRLAAKRLGPPEIFEALAVEDIRAGADLLRQTFEESGGADGFVSLELPPELSRDAKASHAEAARLWRLVDRPNAMIKIPGTVEGLEAVEAAIADGIPINVTLLFSRGRYAATAEAYLRGLERRAKAKGSLKGAASVASFFISRIDSAVDAELGRRAAAASGPAAEALKRLQGRIAIANAKAAFALFQREFSSPRFKALQAHGARPQRLLWASTSSKNPAYKDTVYVEELIGSPTVNTMPPATVDAFRDHGACRPSLSEDPAAAARELAELAELGVDLEAVCARLEAEGLAAFAKSHETLLGRIAAKREIVSAEAGVADAGLAALSQRRFSERLWKKDASLWSQDKGVQAAIRGALGWLDAPETMAAGLSSLRAFAAEVKREGFDAAAVLGMGGSSLACEVLREAFSPAQGHPRLEVLDSTHPDAVRELTKRLPLDRTLFIVSSKSGSTIEPNCFLEHFWSEAERALGGNPGKRFVAITDPGTSLASLARSRGFRRVFTNPPDIGGRYSALSLFGLVPAAAAGLDLDLLLGRARAAARAFAPDAPTAENPALRLGAAIATHAARGQDKLTLSLSPALDSFGLWLEQLVAESLGKDGKGVVPVAGEGLLGPEAYARDRFFVRVALESDREARAEERLSALQAAGHPALELRLKDPYDLGEQFLLWEVATAAAGCLLGVNPFDQPDVQAAKERTVALLSSLKGGALPPEKADFRAGGLAAHADAGLRRALEGRQDWTLREALARHLERLRDGDYLSLLAYAGPSEENRLALEALQAALRPLTRAPVTLSWGPRYLHSTGQLHKGGPDRGVFLMLVEPASADLPVPGRGHGFAALNRAQARGDFQALAGLGRRVLRLELGPAGSGSLKSLPNAARELAKDRACPS